MTSLRKYPLVLVALNQDQMTKAKIVCGSRSRPTHALLCGPYGQIIGTEKHCMKYFVAWKDIFKSLFSKAVETDVHPIDDFDSTFDLVNILSEADDRRRRDR